MKETQAVSRAKQASRDRAQEAGTQDEAVAWFAETFKRPTRILGRLQRQIVESNLERNADRDTDHLHASEMCKRDWCPRSSWYKIKGTRSTASSIKHGLANVFEEGHGIHDKYQRWLYQLGVLEGNYKCQGCGLVTYGVSPSNCSHCLDPRLIYREVPLDDDELFSIGHADGIINDDEGRDLLELKSIGIGTFRIEVPGMYRRYETNQITLTQLWNEVVKPFPGHLRQVNLYMRSTGLRRCVIIYEFKANQQVKEFVVLYDPKLIAPIVKAAKEIKFALENDNVVLRPDWATDDSKVCKQCPYYDTCWKPDEDEEVREAPARFVRKSASPAPHPVPTVPTQAGRFVRRDPLQSG